MSTRSTSWRRPNAGGARRFAASSLKEFIDTPDDVLRPARPLDIAGVQDLYCDVRPVRVNRVEQVRIRHGGSKHLVGQTPVQMDKVRADRRVEVGQAAGKAAHAATPFVAEFIGTMNPTRIGGGGR